MKTASAIHLLMTITSQTCSYQKKTAPIGHWERLHREYLEQTTPMLFNDLILTGKLWAYLADLNEQAQELLRQENS